MNEDIKMIMDELRESAQKSLNHVFTELAKLRAGRATPSMLDSVMVEYYGSKVPLSQVANINTPDAKTIIVKPWEKGMLQNIEKAIQIANLGLNPMNNGDLIMINVPPLTEERRIGLAKQAKSEGEHAKIGIRNARKDANNDIKKTDISDDMKKVSEADVQKLTDSFVKQIEDILSVKEKEIMTV